MDVPLAVLFGTGVSFALLFHLLQQEHHVTLFPSAQRIPGLWVPFSSGVASILIGSVYPYVDTLLFPGRSFKRDWSTVMRSFGIFIGINYASAVSVKCARVSPVAQT